MDENFSQKLSAETKHIESMIWDIAQSNQEDCLALLALLRVIEKLHWEVREKFFHPALPDTRKELYQLLRDIEENGGWPYIERMKLRSLLINLEFEEQRDSQEKES